MTAATGCMWLIPLIGFTFLYKQVIYYSMLNLSAVL